MYLLEQPIMAEWLQWETIITKMLFTKKWSLNDI